MLEIVRVPARELLPYARRVRRSLDRRAHSREHRRPRAVGAVGSVIGAIAAVLALAACGSSSSSTSTVAESAGKGQSTEKQVTSPGNATEAGTTPPARNPTASHIPGCRSVPAPASRAGEQASKPTEQLDPSRSYTVSLATNCGAIVIQLAVKEAPKTTSSFAHLVQTGFYNSLTFHRVVPGFVIQGGDPNGNGTGGPGWEIVEPPPATLRYTRGVVAMAKGPSAPAGSSGSQFFIVTGSTVNLPPAYALVGRVVGGERAVTAISHVPTEASAEGGEGSKPRAPIVIEHAALSVR